VGEVEEAQGSEAIRMKEMDPESTDPDAELRRDPRFEESDYDDLAEGETEIIIGEWIPGSRRPKEAEE
jgi:hypothetical protein